MRLGLGFAQTQPTADDDSDRLATGFGQPSRVCVYACINEPVTMQ